MTLEKAKEELQKTFTRLHASGISAQVDNGVVTLENARGERITMLVGTMLHFSGDYIQ